jgi:hypothetical protein
MIKSINHSSLHSSIYNEASDSKAEIPSQLFKSTKFQMSCNNKFLQSGEFINPQNYLQQYKKFIFKNQRNKKINEK